MDRYFVYSRMTGGNKELVYHSACFIGGHILPLTKNYNDLATLLKKGDNWVYTDEVGLTELQNSTLKVQILRGFEKFHVSMLNVHFINPARRWAAVQKVYLVKILDN